MINLLKFLYAQMTASIKKKLLLMTILFLCVPTIIMGIFAYYITCNLSYKHTQRELESITKDWNTTTYSYLNQLNRLLKREENLTRQRLAGILMMNSKVLNSHFFQYHKNRNDLHELYERMASMKMGKSGHFFILDYNGKYLAYDKESHNSGNFFELIDGPSNVKELKKKLYELKDDQIYFFDYLWKKNNEEWSRKILFGFIYIRSLNVFLVGGIYYTDFQSVELEAQLQNELRHKMAQVKIGEKGYLWVINTDGQIVLSKNFLEDGENVLTRGRENEERFFLKTINDILRIGANETIFTKIPMSDLIDAKSHEMISAISYVSPWRWLIIASADSEEIMKGPFEILKFILIICFVSIVIGSYMAYRFTLSLALPLKKLRDISLNTAFGDWKQDFSELSRRKDEIGILAQAFETMMNDLKKAFEEMKMSKNELENKHRELVIETEKKNKYQKEREELNTQLISTSRLAGMAEVATGVLHNVGNALNSVNLSSSLIGRYLTDMRFEKLEQSFLLLKEHTDSDEKIVSFFIDEKGKNFLSYIGKLIPLILERRFLIEEELKILIESTKHINQIISTQQTFAKKVHLPERINVVEVIENALGMNYFDLLSSKVRVIKIFKETPEILADRHKLLEIILNLVSNAKYSMQRSQEKTLTITIDLSENEGRFCISVRDTGQGISTENIKKIFQHGFTTRSDGHGFGLHISALRAEELGGRLIAHSDGIDKGAVFILEIPLSHPQA